jgi:hypothetical protein
LSGNECEKNQLWLFPNGRPCSSTVILRASNHVSLAVCFTADDLL